MKTFNYGGRKYQYDELSCLPAFGFQIGRLTNSYKTYQTFHLHQDAIAAYEAFEVSNGYKKRLMLIDNTNQSFAIAKQLSKRGE